MTHWIGFTRGSGQDRHELGRLDGDGIDVCEGEVGEGDPSAGELFAGLRPTGERVALAEVAVALPCRPSKIIALWNNFHAAAEKQGLATPAAPLIFIKPPNSYAPSGSTIAIPEAAGRVLYEGELGVVIGRRARDVAEADAAAHIAGYTCLNDVTALAILRADESFAQWTRSKGFDGFCPFGPVIATELDLAAASVRTLVNGRERQSYPLADMMMPPARLVSLLSQGMTLEPGDVIACGTSNGAGPIPRGATVEVVIDGIGTLANRFE